ncbi:mycothiol system anti-sigma-R factor [Agromyces intestinalis]|uniref:Mycothiol system anti-sigma-R factor n=1 Tax=Agromyces intestinalis TaxID=2592652 RepID=A0A5C1YBM0_9MICO|nr:mycothiol system anti-sigma-R factor [Agromyces intestinalis]QEO13483.1 mycothiol system anti-sigma-R factor [Agromyces intestinalis]
MTDCGCEKARQELEEYLHNELRREDAADIREHMANCPECSAELKVGLTITEVVQRACRESAPGELRTAVLSRIREVQAHGTLVVD